MPVAKVPRRPTASWPAMQNPIRPRQGRLRQAAPAYAIPQGPARQSGRTAAASRERMKALTLQEAYRAVAVTEDGRAEPVPAIQAILRSQFELAAKGNIHAQRVVLAAVRAFEEEKEVDAMVEGLVDCAHGMPDRALRHHVGGEPGTGTCDHEPDAEKRDADESP